jgi:hypothetical protein
MRSSFLFLFLIFSAPLHAQFSRGVFLELGGSGGLGSINYEKSFLNFGNNGMLTWRAGLSFSPIDKNNGTAIIFPVMVNAVVGKSKHKFEAGIGQGPTITTKGNFFTRMPLAFCYRYQNPGKSFYLRAGYTPIVSYIVDFQWQHWAGVSFGYAFNTKSP